MITHRAFLVALHSPRTARSTVVFQLGASAPEITVVGLPSLAEVEREVKFDVFSGASQFDGYIVTPLWIGELAEGLFETTDFMKDATVDPTHWTDVLLFYREVISSYDNKLYLLPFDGDVFSMFYRRDLLEKYGKDVPRTWDEYNEVASFFHGKAETIVHENGTETEVTLSGSCVGRAPACGNPYWAQAVLATMTQAKGTYEGSLFDSSNLAPLLGPAMEEALRILGEQTLHGAPDEFEGCVGINVESMNRGECVLTYNWGNSFSDHVREGSVVRGKLGTAPIPGSTLVLNRKTGELEKCSSQEMCPFATVDERTGNLINQAPYGAYGVRSSWQWNHGQRTTSEPTSYAARPPSTRKYNGTKTTGFSGAVSGSVSELHQIAAAEFFAFATSAKKAIKYVIPDANNPDANPLPTGMDPYAKSMLDVDEWTSRGFDRQSTEEYKYAIESQLGSSNVVIDLRVPTATDLYDALDDVTTRYCNDTKWNRHEKDAASVREDLAAELASRWLEIITDFDSSEGRRKGNLLELYQRDRGVYVAPEDAVAREERSGDAGIIVAIVVCVAAVVAIALLLVFILAKHNMARKREDMWYVDPTDIHDTYEVLGRGSFGVVTKGFLRGTPVALKHAKGWEPQNIPLVGEAMSGSGGDDFADNIGDPNRASLQSSFADNNEMDASTIGATLLTEPSTDERRFYLFRKKQRTHGAEESLRAELLLLVKLRHDNIVQTLGASKDAKQLVLILQYMEHGPIRNVLKDKDANGVAGTAGMSLEIQWALQVARGLNFLHTIPPPSGPMVHADLKSSNVLLDSSYNANISDFGLATKTMGGLWGAIQRSTKSNNPRGSFLWMAPEVLNGAEPTPASDVYSYSMLLVELMTRDRPYGLRVFESAKSATDGKNARRISEGSVDTEYDRRLLSDSERRESELSSDVPDTAAEPAQPVLPENEEEPKQTNAEGRSRHRVSWSIASEDAPEAKAEEKKGAASKFKPGRRDFYTVIDGETLARGDVINKVKDLSLDPPFRPTLPDTAPQILRTICTECWSNNPKRRPTMKEVEERLTEAMSSKTWMQQLMKRGSVFDSILPPDVQDSLAKGEAIKPRTYENVTVIFSDIVGFTSISSALTSEEVGDLIYRLFSQFDALCKSHSVKKLDLIGDCFLGVVGVPTAVPDHARLAARFALEAIKSAQRTLICTAKPQLGYAKVRFGLASGSCVATVIGTLEYPKYTLFGDAVNTASRMESTSSPNMCQVTEETAGLIRNSAEGSDLILVSRGKKDVKGKGEMETFFVKESRRDGVISAAVAKPIEDQP
ncbi:hypothetical protein ACHAWF_011875 [Thalassiosira exigua]